MADRSDNFIGGTYVIAALTFLSRMLGLVRDVLCAAVFGAGVEWDAFVFAFRIPNLFRRLFGEGALSAAFVPAFAERLETGGTDEAGRFAGRVAAALTVLLIAVLLVGEGVVLALLRWSGPTVRWRLALSFTAVLLPYMVFICLTALAGAVLQSMRRFAAPAFAPVLLNVCWIAGAVVAVALVPAEGAARIYIVAGAIVTAGVLQLALQLWVLRRGRFRWRPSLEPGHSDVKAMAATMLPVVLGLAAVQINVVIDGLIAVGLAAPPGRETFELLGATVSYPLAAGANSVLYYANRLMQFPLGVFGIALATAAFPRLSRHAARNDWEGFSRSTIEGLRLVLFIGVPASVGLMLLREPLVELLFNRGLFRRQGAAARTAAVLLSYSTAIWAYCALHVLSRAFYSIGRHSTPARVAAGMVVLNLALNLALVWPLRECGLAAATAICAVVQAAVLFRLLDRRVGLTGKGVLAVTAARTALACLVMAAVCWGSMRALPADAAGMTWDVLRVALPALAGAAAYTGAARAVRAEELRMLLDGLRRR